MASSAFIVQEHETGLFLAPGNGSVVFVKLLRDAGEFPDDESAVLTALDWCEQGFTVVRILPRVK
jgi:hypothetical protein